MPSRIRTPATAFPLTGGLKKHPRVEDKGYLAFVRKLPSIVSGSHQNVQACHVRYSSPSHGKRETGMGEKPDDRWAVPLTADEHLFGKDSQHASGERGWWRRQGIDPLCVAALLFSAYKVGDEAGAYLICTSSRDLALWSR